MESQAVATLRQSRRNARLAAQATLHEDALAREQLEETQRTADNTSRDPGGDVDASFLATSSRNGWADSGSTDLMDAYESPVIPEVDVVERPVRGSVPELVSDSESEQSEEVPDELSV